MPTKREKLRVYAYGRNQNFRFWVTIRVTNTGTLSQRIGRMRIAARREVNRVWLESREIYMARYGVYLAPIYFLRLSNGMELRV